ncbi:MAG: PilZ domain-containing protein [Myxococcales bacterium]|nr:PilZ domain-containing protein [Myxococcales bacterium]
MSDDDRSDAKKGTVITTNVDETATPEARRSERVPLQLVVREMIEDQPRQCLSLDASEDGIYLSRLAGQRGAPHDQMRRDVQLELEIPGHDEVIWARGEVMYDRFDAYFHGSGVRLADMASTHRRILRDYIAQQRVRRLSAALQRARARRDPAGPN